MNEGSLRAYGESLTTFEAGGSTWTESIRPATPPTQNPDAVIYANLCAYENIWFETKLTGVNADKSFDETLAYIKRQMEGVRDGRTLHSEWGSTDGVKPYRLMIRNPIAPEEG